MPVTPLVTPPVAVAPVAPVTERPHVLVLASYQYMNYPVALAHLQSLPSSTFSIASQMGVGHALLKNAPVHSLAVAPLRWQPTRPYLEVAADHAIIFWDGHDRSLLPSVAFLRKAAVPLTIIDADGNPVDLTSFCATLTSSNGDKMAAPIAPTAPTAPTVIVDAPAPPLHERESKVLVKLSLPERIFTQYEDQARAAKQNVEKVLADRLRGCILHTSGRGLYFNDEQRAHLERITGGHLITDADAALARVRTTVEVQVGGITIELTDRILQRCASRAKSERKSLEQYVVKEVTQGLERSCGLRPW